MGKALRPLLPQYMTHEQAKEKFKEEPAGWKLAGETVTAPETYVGGGFLKRAGLKMAEKPGIFPAIARGLGKGEEKFITAADLPFRAAGKAATTIVPRSQRGMQQRTIQVAVNAANDVLGPMVGRAYRPESRAVVGDILKRHLFEPETLAPGEARFGDLMRGLFREDELDTLAGKNARDMISAIETRAGSAKGMVKLKAWVQRPVLQDLFEGILNKAGPGWLGDVWKKTAGQITSPMARTSLEFPGYLAGNRFETGGLWGLEDVAPNWLGQDAFNRVAEGLPGVRRYLVEGSTKYTGMRPGQQTGEARGLLGRILSKVSMVNLDATLDAGMRRNGYVQLLKRNYTAGAEEAAKTSANIRALLDMEGLPGTVAPEYTHMLLMRAARRGPEAVHMAARDISPVQANRALFQDAINKYTDLPASVRATLRDWERGGFKESADTVLTRLKPQWEQALGEEVQRSPDVMVSALKEAENGFKAGSRGSDLEARLQELEMFRDEMQAIPRRQNNEIMQVVREMTPEGKAAYLRVTDELQRMQIQEMADAFDGAVKAARAVTLKERPELTTSLDISERIGQLFRETWEEDKVFRREFFAQARPKEPAELDAWWEEYFNGREGIWSKANVRADELAVASRKARIADIQASATARRALPKPENVTGNLFESVAGQEARGPAHINFLDSLRKPYAKRMAEAAPAAGETAAGETARDVVTEAQQRALPAITARRTEEWGLLSDDLRRIAQENPSLAEDMAQAQRVVNEMAEISANLSPAERQTLKTIEEKAGSEANRIMDWVHVNYADENMVDAAMRAGGGPLPYWVYESRRWPRIARYAAQKPGLAKAVINYYNSTDEGYFRVPGTPLEVSALRFTGATTVRSVLRPDFDSHYDGLLGKIDKLSSKATKFGFYPMTVDLATAIVSGEWGDIAPPELSAALAAGQALGIPGVKQLPSAFHERLVRQQLAASGVDPDKATDEERAAAEKTVAKATVPMELVGAMRIRPEEIDEMKRGRLEAAIAAGVPKETAQDAFAEGRNPISAVDDQEKYILTATQRDQAVQDAAKRAGVQPDVIRALSDISLPLRPGGERQRAELAKEYSQASDLIKQGYGKQVGAVADTFQPGVNGQQVRDQLSALKDQRWGARQALNDPQGRYAEIVANFDNPEKLTRANRQDLLFNLYMEAVGQPDLKDALGNYNYAARDAIDEKVKATYGDETWDAIQTRLHKDEHPLERELRLDQEKISDYWGLEEDLWARMTANEPSLQGVSLRQYTTQIQLEATQMGIDPSEDPRWQFLDEVTATLSEVREIYRRRHPDINAILIKWGYASTAKTKEAQALFKQQYGYAPRLAQ
jgi:hypothetical protein